MKGIQTPSFIARAGINHVAYRISAYFLVFISGVCFIYTLKNIARTVRRFGFADMPIFLETARNFLHGMPLYTNALADYMPSAAIYKYPPFLMMFLVPLAKYDSHIVLWTMWVLFIFIYLGSCWYGMKFFCSSLSAGSKKIYFFIIAIATLNFSPFYETILGIQFEIVFLFLFLACMDCINKSRNFLAGSLIAIASMLKVYPVFMMLYFVVQFRWSAWTGFLFGLLAIIFCQMAVLGYESTYQYFSKILPALLQEPILLTNENVNLAQIFASSGLVPPEISLAASRAVSLLLFVGFCLVFVVRKRKVLGASDKTLVFSFIIVLMLLLVTNSWANYQVLLMFPFMALFAYALKISSWRLLCWTGFVFLLTVFTQNAWVSNMTIFPMSWHASMSMYRGSASLMLVVTLLWVLWRTPSHQDSTLC